MKTEISKFLPLALCSFLPPLFLAACGPGFQPPPAAPLDFAAIDHWSRMDCPAGTVYRPRHEDYRIYIDEPAGPLLFVVNKGDAACVTHSPHNEWGWSDWLNIDFSNQCLANNSVWRRTRYSISDSVHVFAHFERVDRPQTDWIDLQANYGRRFSSLNQAVGLVTYSCQ